jgi:hypothetical protein
MNDESSQQLPSQPQSTMNDAGSSILPGPIERQNLAAALQSLTDRIKSLESTHSNSAKSGPGLEIFKTALASWPAFAIIFLLLFYGSIRDSLSALPAKIKAATEFGALGVSFKSTIQSEATKIGASALSSTIPKLSAAAIEYLLRVPSNGLSLLSYTPNEKSDLSALFIPTVQTIKILEELESAGLIEVRQGSNAGQPIKVSAVEAAIVELVRANPGTREDIEPNDRYRYVPKSPIPKAVGIPYFRAVTTPLGSQANAVIVRAVAAELTPTK